jgi:hypothetical protein
MEADEPTAAAAEATRRQDDAETHEVQQLRVMEQPNWTEGRLDDLNNNFDVASFERMNQGRLSGVGRARTVGHGDRRH